MTERVRLYDMDCEYTRRYRQICSRDFQRYAAWMTSPVTFEIWDRGSGNRLGEYATETAARETMRTITDADPGEIGSLVLLEMDGDGRPSVVGAKEDFGGHGVLGDD